MNEEQTQLPGFELVEPPAAAVNRHYHQLGETWEQAREIFALAGDRGYYVHNLNIRWPSKANKDVLLIVKVLHEEGPMVAFHSGYVWTHLIPTFADRMRAGTVNWLQDEFPPDKWADKLYVLVNLPRIRR